MERDSQGRMRAEAATWLGAAGVYIVITLLFFGPVLGRLDSVFLGDGGDNFQFAWNAWWVTRSLTAGHNPYFCDIQFTPFGVPLVFHTLSLIPSLVIGLLTTWLSQPLAYNLVVIALFPIAGLCSFALARHITGGVVGAVAGGVVYMICPFLASKVIGHLNLQCAALLPLYTLCLIGGMRDGTRRRRWTLAIVFVLMLFSNIHTTIFAANITAWYFIYRACREGHWRLELRRFWRLLQPVVIISAGWGVFVAYYALRYSLLPERFGSLVWCPEPLSFVLPLHANSVWHDKILPQSTLTWELSNLELAVYVGWLVLPLAVAGWWLMWKTPDMKFMVAVFVCALALAPGQKLQWQREIVRVSGVPVYLPMGLYRYVPVLGAVGQSGRYMVIGYMALGVGVAGLVAAVRRRFGGKATLATASVAIALTCVDYGFRPVVVDIPTCPIPPGAGRVLDPRLGNARTLYFQTIHGRELVGGYVARIPVRLREAYAATPGIGWFFQHPIHRRQPPSASELLKALETWNIVYVCVDRGGEEQRVLEAAGLHVVHEDDGGTTLMR